MPCLSQKRRRKGNYHLISQRCKPMKVEAEPSMSTEKPSALADIAIGII